MMKKMILLLFFIATVCSVRAQDKKINVYAFVAEECPISIFMASSLKAVAEMYEKEANFYLVFPVSNSSVKTATAFKKKHKLSQFSIIVDSTQQLTASLAARVTPEVVITNQQAVVIYKGRINDAYAQPGKRKHIFSNHDLSNALEKIVAGQLVPQPWKPAIGCFITMKKMAK